MIAERPMPGCLGAQETSVACRVRPRWFVLGGAVIEGQCSLVFVAVCPLHRDGVVEWLMEAPLDVMAWAYDPVVWRHLLALGEGEDGPPAYELLRWREGVGGP
jgi:hypothetical protein